MPKRELLTRQCKICLTAAAQRRSGEDILEPAGWSTCTIAPTDRPIRNFMLCPKHTIELMSRVRL